MIVRTYSMQYQILHTRLRAFLIKIFNLMSALKYWIICLIYILYWIPISNVKTSAIKLIQCDNLYLTLIEMILSLIKDSEDDIFICNLFFYISCKSLKYI